MTMSTLPTRPLRREVEYPESDGKPIAETELHLLVMFEVIESLRAWYAANTRVWVGGNQLLYYVEGDPRRCTSPDVMVALGIGKKPLRRTYLVWKEGKAPDVVIEVSSRKTRREDLGKKFELYRDVLKVREYFLFDPLAEYLKPSLKGYRLLKGEYVPIPSLDGRLPSKVLGLHLERDGEWLRLYNPKTERWLLTATEVRERLDQEANERKQAEAARRKAEAARKAEAEAREQAEARQQAEAEAREQAEAEVERLRREVEALRRQVPRSF
jgi:Uma2 family endonuclease